MNVLVPITDHPSASVAMRAKLILAAGGVTVHARCPNGFVAQVRGKDSDAYAVRVTPAGASCSCVATRLCAHIGAAGLAAADVPLGDHQLAAEGACSVCRTALPGRFEALLARMARS